MIIGYLDPWGIHRCSLICLCARLYGDHQGSDASAL